MSKFDHGLFWKRLTERRKEMGISERALSLAVTGKEAYVRDIKRKKSRPRIDNIHAIAKTLQCSVEYLIGQADTPGRAPSAPTIDKAILKKFILEALKYQGVLSDEDVARLAAEAFAQHYEDGMTPQELRRVLQFHEPANTAEKSH